MKKIYIKPQTVVVRISQTLLQSASAGGPTLNLTIDETEEVDPEEQLSRKSVWDDDDADW